MTTAELFNRMIVAFGVRRMEDLMMDDAQFYVDAINSALSTYYALIPPVHKKHTFSHLAPAPKTVSLELTNGSKVVGGVTPLTNSERWATIKIDGDEKWNRVADTDGLLDAYEGPTGTHSATVYGDVVVLDGLTVESMVSEPRLSTGEVLLRDEALREYRYGYGAPYATREVYGANTERQIGRPKRYYLDTVADLNDTQVEPTGFVCLDPLPDVAYTARFEAIVFPIRFGLSIIQAPKNLPVPQSHIELGLIPLVFEALIESGYNPKDPNKIQIFLHRAEKARNFIETRPAYIAVPNNQEGTPRGF